MAIIQCAVAGTRRELVLDFAVGNHEGEVIDQRIELAQAARKDSDVVIQAFIGNAFKFSINSR